MDQIFDSQLLESMVRASIPILLAALGGLLAERAGVFQISLEGLMLSGAFAAVAGSYFAGQWVAILCGAAAGGLVSLILAYGAVSRNGNPIVIGIAINLLALGLTAFLLAEVFGVRGVFLDPAIEGLSRYSIPGLENLPIIGPALFRQTILGYLALLAVPAISWMLFRTKVGLHLRGVGESPDAAATLGVNPIKIKYGAVFASGIAAGLAGTQLALGNVVQFAENMSAGRGWIAVVAVLLGRAHPWGVAAAVALFGLSEAVGFRLQGNGMPSQITDVLPFALTLLALVFARKRFKALLDLSASE
jgi:ABC-type uncharacterized transport system permease subunit